MKSLFSFLTVFLTLFAQSGFAMHHATAEKSSEKAVLVTGASSGIGARITEVLSKNGYVVYATARKEADLKRLEAMENVESIKLDVTNQQQIDSAVAIVKAKGRGLYGLVNNAGIAIIGPIVETPVEELEWQMNVNVLGPYRITQAFAPLIIKSKGRITTTGSISGILSGNLFGPYSMSKHAIEAFTDSLAIEMKRFDVEVSVIEPGNYASKIGQTFAKRFENNKYVAESSPYAQDIKKMTENRGGPPQGKDPLEVANAVLHFMSSATPKRRYMVTPNAGQAHYTVAKAIREALQLNHGHEYSLSKEDLIQLVEKELAELP